MRDLRDGVKLKKVQERQYNPLPIEYQLTPYEMLMDDIRSKRYKLRKVMVKEKKKNSTGRCNSVDVSGYLSEELDFFSAGGNMLQRLTKTSNRTQE